MNELLAVVAKHLNSPFAVSPETPLISSGLIDSFRLVTLVSALEEQFGVRINCEEIGSDNFDTPAQMLTFLQKGE